MQTTLSRISALCGIAAITIAGGDRPSFTVFHVLGSRAFWRLYLACVACAETAVRRGCSAADAARYPPHMNGSPVRCPGRRNSTRTGIVPAAAGFCALGHWNART